MIRCKKYDKMTYFLAKSIKPFGTETEVSVGATKVAKPQTSKLIPQSSILKSTRYPLPSFFHLSQ